MNFDKLEPKTPPPNKRSRLYRAAKIAAALALISSGICGSLIAIKWPFTRDKIAARLGKATSSSVRFHGFQTKYFPPGCVIEGLEVRLQDDPGSAPLMTIGRLTIRTNYRDLLRQRIEVMRLEDVRVDAGQRRAITTASRAGSNGSSKGSSKKNSTSIAELIIESAVVEVPRKDKPALLFNIHQLTLDNVIQGEAITFHLALDNPLPPGRVRGDGQFNPWNSVDAIEIPLSGEYEFSDAKLDSIRGIGGTLSSQGSFAGPAGALRVQGTTDTPDYQVESAGHPVHLRTDFQAIVNCGNGDVILQNVRAQFGDTTAHFEGAVTRQARGPRVASLQVEDPGGRIEDWLRLLTREKIPAMTGPITFQAHVTIPGGKRPFIQRIRVQGEFGLDGAAFTRPETQQKVGDLSLRAGGQKVPKEHDATSSATLVALAGQVELVGGVARFSTLSFAVPGALANMRGTYSLNDQQVDLRGELAVDTKFSKTAKGSKTHLLTWAAERLFAKSAGTGEILPIKLTGTYKHPSFGLTK